MVDTDSKTSDLDKLDSRVRQTLDAGAEFDQDTMLRLHAMRSAAVARARADAVEAAADSATQRGNRLADRLLSSFGVRSFAYTSAVAIVALVLLGRGGDDSDFAVEDLSPIAGLQQPGVSADATMAEWDEISDFEMQIALFDDEADDLALLESLEFVEWLETQDV